MTSDAPEHADNEAAGSALHKTTTSDDDQSQTIAHDGPRLSMAELLRGKSKARDPDSNRPLTKDELERAGQRVVEQLLRQRDRDEEAIKLAILDIAPLRPSQTTIEWLAETLGRSPTEEELARGYQQIMENLERVRDSHPVVPVDPRSLLAPVGGPPQEEPNPDSDEAWLRRLEAEAEEEEKARGIQGGIVPGGIILPPGRADNNQASSSEGRDWLDLLDVSESTREEWDRAFDMEETVQVLAHALNVTASSQITVNPADLPLGTVTPLKLSNDPPRYLAPSIAPFSEFHAVAEEIRRQTARAIARHRPPPETVSPVLTPEERSRHIYILGASGMGKSELLRSFMQHDLRAGEGFGLFDPNTALITRLLTDLVHYGFPTERIIYIDPADSTYAVGFNPLELPAAWADSPQLADTFVSQLYDVFAARWKDAWGPRMGDLLSNALLTLADARMTLAELPDLLTNAAFRAHCVRHTKNAFVRKFWATEFDVLSDRERHQWTGPVLNKVRDFLRPPAVRGILCQAKSTIDLEAILDAGYVLLVNLNPAEIGEANARLIGQLLLAKLQATAFRRPPGCRPWTLYLDEFQDFLASSSAEKVATMLAQARKFGLRLVMAHQDLAQVQRQDPHLVPSILTNTETQIIFASNHADARLMASQIPITAEVVPERVDVELQEKTYVYSPRSSTENIMTATVTRPLFTAEGKPLAEVVQVIPVHRARSLLQVFLQEEPPGQTIRYLYGGREYTSERELMRAWDWSTIYVADGMFGDEGDRVSLKEWLSHPAGKDFETVFSESRSKHWQSFHLSVDEVSFGFWDFAVTVKTTTVKPDWAQIILGLTPRTALIRRRGSAVGLLRTPDVAQVHVPEATVKALVTTLQERWGRLRATVEEEIIARSGGYQSTPTTPPPPPRARPVRRLPQEPAAEEKPEFPPDRKDTFFEIE